VIEKSLAGTIGLFVKFSTLQEYGVDKVFFLENHNVDASQRNVVFLVRGEAAKKVQIVAGMSTLHLCARALIALPVSPSSKLHQAPGSQSRMNGYPPLPLRLFSLDPEIKHFRCQNDFA
jgi:hypothetical protein